MQNLITIKLTLSEQGLKRFKTVPTFKNLLHPNQLNDLVVGDNILNVNNTVWGSLQRMVSNDKLNMSIKRLV